MNRYIIIKSLDKLLTRSDTEEVNLWREVIRQAFIDLLIISKNKKYDLLKKEAYKWLATKSKDYYLVCALAQIKEEQINNLFKEAKKIYKKSIKTFEIKKKTVSFSSCRKSVL
jgi:hypothetical protein